MTIMEKIKKLSPIMRFSQFTTEAEKLGLVHEDTLTDTADRLLLVFNDFKTNECYSIQCQVKFKDTVLDDNAEVYLDTFKQLNI